MIRYVVERMRGNMEERWILEGFGVMLKSVDFILGGGKRYGF